MSQARLWEVAALSSEHPLAWENDILNQELQVTLHQTAILSLF